MDFKRPNKPMVNRRKSRQVQVGKIAIGGNAPIAIQSMTNTVTSDVRATVAQIKRLEAEGCEIVRVAVKTLDDAAAIRRIRGFVKIPIVSDIHFDYRLALASIKSGADKIRLNPGNMRNLDEVRLVVKAAKSSGIPIRIGVNSGSMGLRDEGRGMHALRSSTIEGGLKSEIGRDDYVKTLVSRVKSYLKLFESIKFRDIVISVKSSDVPETVEAYSSIARICDYPLHLGVTATGPESTGVIKSSIGIGSLLLDGIGDTVRVSLTADPVNEVSTAKRILQSAGVRSFGPEIISCPTCGRCQVDLVKIVSDMEKRLRDEGRRMRDEEKAYKIAIMGCEVNGPGEARDADVGVAFGKNVGALFVKGKIIRRIKAKDAVKEILKTIKSL